MIKTNIYKRGNVYIGFSIKGHAGYAEYGYDIVCAAVTSAVQLTINGIVEILKVKANVQVLENEISIKLDEIKADESALMQAQSFFKAFELHLQCLAEDYEDTIKITNVEV